MLGVGVGWVYVHPVSCMGTSMAHNSPVAYAVCVGRIAGDEICISRRQNACDIGNVLRL